MEQSKCCEQIYLQAVINLCLEIKLEISANHSETKQKLKYEQNTATKTAVEVIFFSTQAFYFSRIINLWLFVVMQNLGQHMSVWEPLGSSAKDHLEVLRLLLHCRK